MQDGSDLQDTVPTDDAKLLQTGQVDQVPVDQLLLQQLVTMELGKLDA